MSKDLEQQEVISEGVEFGEDKVQVEIGQWYWVRNKKKVVEDGEWEEVDDDYDEDEDLNYEGDDDIEDEPKEKEWLGCVIHVGSNYIKLRSPSSGSSSYHSVRIHFDDFFDRLRRELGYKEIIQKEIEFYRNEVQKKIGKVKAITSRLGVSSHQELGHQESSGRALAKLSGTDNVKKYKKDLVRAMEKQLPELFKEIKHANQAMANWMSAEVLPMEAAAKQMTGCIGQIEDRIFNVGLYAGLTENITKVQDGEPAPFEAKLHLMQRMLFMDEECLANYRHGGMEFNDMEDFDEWLLEPENLSRILPMPRTVVAFRVRRNTKERYAGDSLSATLIKIDLEKHDLLTYLYIRNGEQVYRMSCDLEFGQFIFPDKHAFDPTEPMMFKMFCNNVDEMVTKREFDVMVKERDAEKVLAKEWAATHPDKDSWRNPHEHHSGFNPGDWMPFDKSCVYYDEALEDVTDRVKHYNRIALILQGLYDRSEILHPHPPAKLWNAKNFEQIVTLVYDGSSSMHHGEAPSFEEYRAKCNESIGRGSLTIGQDDFWQEKEAKKENDRRDRSWRETSTYRHKRYKPYDNDGPGYIAEIVNWGPRTGKATYHWTRGRRNVTQYGQHYDDKLNCKITVPEDRLFNVSAYKLGDYKKFFTDSRTRAQYLKWAPMLIAAEEHHAPKQPKKKKRKKRSKWRSK